jgi:hypothetical protein
MSLFKDSIGRRETAGGALATVGPTPGGVLVKVYISLQLFVHLHKLVRTSYKLTADECCDS